MMFACVLSASLAVIHQQQGDQCSSLQLESYSTLSVGINSWNPQWKYQTQLCDVSGHAGKC